MTQMRNICFTSFNTEINWEQDYTLKDKSPIQYIITQGELTKDLKQHIQGYAQFTRKQTLKQIKTFFQDNTLHIEESRGTPEQASNYCKEIKNGIFRTFIEYGEMKQPGKRTDILHFRNMITEGQTLKNILRTSQEPKIIQLIAQYGKQFKELEKTIYQETVKESFKIQYINTIWKPYQQKILDIIIQEPDIRQVHWIYDKYGNSGKFYLARYINITHDTYYITAGKQTDILYGYDNQPIIIYDLARTQADNLDHIYTTIEQFKNGMYLSTKYETVQKIFKIPHIIILANFKPDTSKLSQDRWNITDITNIETNSQTNQTSRSIFQELLITTDEDIQMAHNKQEDNGVILDKPLPSIPKVKISKDKVKRISTYCHKCDIEYISINDYQLHFDTNHYEILDIQESLDLNIQPLETEDHINLNNN